MLNTTLRPVMIAGLAALSMSLSSAVFAQTAQSEETAPAADIESQLSLGADADTPTDLGQIYVKEEIGDWEMRCVRTETPEDDPCQMYQLLIDEADAPVAEFTLFRLADGGKAEAGATVTVPLETSLPNQLTVQIDGGATKRYPYAFCTQVGCHARIGLTAEDIAAYKRGNAARVTLVPAIAPDQKVVLSLSLTGFTASYDKVSVIER